MNNEHVDLTQRAGFFFKLLIWAGQNFPPCSMALYKNRNDAIAVPIYNIIHIYYCDV